MSDPFDAEDRAIARALDAAPQAETEGADERLVDEYREVLDKIQPAPVGPPAELEDRIVAAALARRPAAVAATAAPVADLDTARTRRRLRARVAVLAASIVAAAVVVGVIVQHDNSAPAVAGGHLSLTTLRRADIDALVRSPGSRTATFGAGPARVVIAADGRAAVYGLSSARPVSIGLTGVGGTKILGPAPPVGGVISFVVVHPERVVTVTVLGAGVEIERADLSPK